MLPNIRTAAITAKAKNSSQTKSSVQIYQVVPLRLLIILYRIEKNIIIYELLSHKLAWLSMN